MRYILLTTVVALYGCASISNLPPAGPSTVMMEKADRIIVTTDRNPEDAFRRVGQYISDLGFAFHNTDETLLSIQTKYKTFGVPPFGQYTFRLNASVRDSSIHFYAQTGNELFGEYEITNEDSGTNKKAWEKLVEIATGYPHEEVYYSRN